MTTKGVGSGRSSRLATLRKRVNMKRINTFLQPPPSKLGDMTDIQDAQG